MTPSIKKNLLIPFSILLLTALLYSLSHLAPELRNRFQHIEFFITGLLILTALAVMLFWVSLGVFGGLASLLLSLVFLYRPVRGLDPYYYSVFIMAFFLSGYLGHHIFRGITKASQEFKVGLERVEEDTNLIREHFANRVAEIEAIEDKVTSLFKLKNILDSLSLSLSTEEVVRIVSEKTFDKFGAAGRVMFFLVEGNEPALVHTVKSEKRAAPLMKKGGIFERWVVKSVKSLLVRDAGEDFRFSVEGDEKNDDAVSIISKPLVGEGKVVGVLRVDSNKEDAFKQHDLRILDIIGELASVALGNAALYERTKELAVKDSLTGLFVHKYFMERLEEEVKRSLRSGNALTLFMLDIDDFKEFNDKYGHIAGDMILKKVSQALADMASPGDVVCRYGGEEFAFLALDRTKKESEKIAKDIKGMVEASRVAIRREEKSVTVSIGIAAFPDDAKGKEELVWEADRRLYAAKAAGKNRICSE